MTATLLALMLLLVPTAATAGTACWTIEDPDQRAYCRAQQSSSAGDCTTISDHALRQTCRARVTSNPNPCNSVTGQWERQKCRDEAARRAGNDPRAPGKSK